MHELKPIEQYSKRRRRNKRSRRQRKRRRIILLFFQISKCRFHYVGK